MSDKVYRVRLAKTEAYEADVVASNAQEAADKARRGEWEEVWNTGEVISRTVRGVHRITEPEVER